MHYNEKSKFLSDMRLFTRRIHIQRKFRIAALIVLFGLSSIVQSMAVCQVNLEANPKAIPKTSTTDQKKKETTIRNVTDEVIHYTIKPFNSYGKPKERTLKVGAIDRFLGNMELRITFQSNKKTITYSLDPGMPYSFRYDENGELELYDGSHGRADAPDLAPFVSTPMIVVEKMLELAKVDKNDLLFDLGCGDGRIVILAARKYGARGVGIDIDPQRIEESNIAAKMAGVEKLVEFRLQDITKADFSKATVVILYLLEESNVLLRPLLEKQLKPGTYVVSHNYPILGWEEKEVDFVSLVAEDAEEHDIYVYRR